MPNVIPNAVAFFRSHDRSRDCYSNRNYDRYRNPPPDSSHFIHTCYFSTVRLAPSRLAPFLLSPLSPYRKLGESNLAKRIHYGECESIDRF